MNSKEAYRTATLPGCGNIFKCKYSLPGKNLQMLLQINNKTNFHGAVQTFKVTIKFKHYLSAKEGESSEYDVAVIPRNGGTNLSTSLKNQMDGASRKPWEAVSSGNDAA